MCLIYKVNFDSNEELFDLSCSFWQRELTKDLLLKKKVQNGKPTRQNVVCNMHTVHSS